MMWDGAAKNDKGRSPKPSQFYDGATIFSDLCQSIFGIVQHRCEGEADDAVASAAVSRSTIDEVVYVGSLDKDIQQVVDGNIKFFSFRLSRVIERSEILERWNIKHPAHLAIALAIQGDSTDKIGGIRGYGPKKVKELMEHVDETTSLGEAMEIIIGHIPDKHHDEFISAFELTALNTTIPTPDPTRITINADAVPESMFKLKRSLGWEPDEM